MATRQQIQIAQDVVRFVNIANDLVDCMSFILKGLDPQTGEPLIDDATGKPFTVEQIQTRVRKSRAAVLGYWQRIKDFYDAYGNQAFVAALSTQGVDATELMSDIDRIKSAANHVAENIGAVDFKNLAGHIDTNVPKLPLVRRSWCIGK